jgi:hypothetical protein
LEVVLDSFVWFKVFDLLLSTFAPFAKTPLTARVIPSAARNLALFFLSPVPQATLSSEPSQAERDSSLRSE